MGLLGSIGNAMNPMTGVKGLGGQTDTSSLAKFMGPQFSNLNNFGPNPYSSALQSQLSSLPQFQALGSSAVGSAYQAKNVAGQSLPEYDAMRQRLNSQYSQVQSQGQDALDRQFAAMGGGPGNGAQAKQTENLAASVGQQKDSDLQNLGFQEAQQQRGLQQQQDQMAFSSQENLANRNLQAQEFNQQGQQQQNQFNFGANAQIAGLNTSWDQAQAEANNNEFNKQLQMYQLQHSGGLLGAGGVLGTGLGGSYMQGLG